MTFPKKQYIFLLIFLLVIIGIVFVSQNKFSASFVQLDGFWWLLQEQVSDHPLVQRQSYLQTKEQLTQEIESKIHFDIDPSLFTNNTTGNRLLSGHLTLQTQWQESPDSQIQTFDINLSGQITGIEEAQEIIQIDFQASWTWIKDKDEVYFQLTHIHLDQSPRESEHITLRYLLLKQYEKKYIHISDVHQLFLLLSPRLVGAVLKNNSKKIRILPYQQWWRLYSFSGDNIQGSGYYFDPNNQHFTLSLPKYQTDIVTQSTNIPHIHDLHIIQNNAYKWSFQGVLETQITKKKILQHIKGEATRPKGIWLDIENKLSISRSSLKSPPKIPQQFLERETILERWKNSMEK